MHRVTGALRVLLVAAMCAAFAVLPLGSSPAMAYTGEQQMWRMLNFRDQAVIVVSRYDTGDVNLNTAAVEQIDAKFVRQNLGSEYKRVKSTGYEEALPGTTVVRKFTFVMDGQDGILIATDEWGPHIWLFLFSDDSLRDSVIDRFVSATVQASWPTEIPSGYGSPEEMDV